MQKWALSKPFKWLCCIQIYPNSGIYAIFLSIFIYSLYLKEYYENRRAFCILSCKKIEGKWCSYWGMAPCPIAWWCPIASRTDHVPSRDRDNFVFAKIGWYVESHSKDRFLFSYLATSARMLLASLACLPRENLAIKLFISQNTLRTHSSWYVSARSYFSIADLISQFLSQRSSFGRDYLLTEPYLISFP